MSSSSFRAGTMIDTRRIDQKSPVGFAVPFRLRNIGNAGHA